MLFYVLTLQDTWNAHLSVMLAGKKSGNERQQLVQSSTAVKQHNTAIGYFECQTATKLLR